MRLLEIRSIMVAMMESAGYWISIESNGKDDPVHLPGKIVAQDHYANKLEAYVDIFGKYMERLYRSCKNKEEWCRNNGLPVVSDVAEDEVSKKYMAAGLLLLAEQMGHHGMKIRNEKRKKLISEYLCED